MQRRKAASKITLFFSALLLLFSHATNAYAQHVDRLTLQEEARAKFKQTLGYKYIYASELDPQRALPLWQAAPGGAYVSVGTERAFMGAANSPATSHLMMVDSDPAIILYNKLNLALLTVAKDYYDYLFLRFKAQQAEWVSRARGISHPELSRMLTDSDLFRWWEFTQGTDTALAQFTLNAQLKIGSNKNRTADRTKNFEKVNYLENEALFNKLSVMAKARRINIFKADLDDANALAELSNMLLEKGIKISTLDISNAWKEAFVQRSDTAVNAFKRNVLPRTLVMGTLNKAEGFVYSAFTIEFLTGMGFFNPKPRTQTYLRQMFEYSFSRMGFKNSQGSRTHSLNDCEILLL